MIFKARGIDDEPAFAWWVPHNLSKRDMIISKINTRVSRKMHKFEIEVPTSIKQAKQIDPKNGNTLWCDRIAKEKYNISVAFKILEGHASPPTGWTKSSGHCMFVVKMDFTRKAIWVKDGH